MDKNDYVYRQYLKYQKYEDEDNGYNSGGEREKEEGCGIAMDSREYYYYKYNYNSKFSYQ